MKRILHLLLAVIVSLSCTSTLSACGKAGSFSNNFFKGSSLSKTGLIGLEAPNFEMTYNGYSNISGLIEKSEFDRYVKYVLHFIREKYEIVGTEGYEYSTFFGGAGTYKFIECGDNLEDYLAENNEFVIKYIIVYYTKPLDKVEFTADKVELEYRFKEYKRTYNDKEYRYNFDFSLKNIMTCGLTDKYYLNNDQPADFHSVRNEDYTLEGSDPIIDLIFTQEEWDKKYSEKWWEYLASPDENNPVIIVFLPIDAYCHYNIKDVKIEDGNFVLYISHSFIENEVSYKDPGVAELIIELIEPTIDISLDNIVLNITK